MKMFHRNQHSTVSEIFCILGLIILSATIVRCHTETNTLDGNKSPKSCVVPNHKGTSYFLATGCTDQQRCDSVVREGENECCDSVLEAGQSIAGNGTVLGLKCADSFILRRPHSDIVVCYDGKWYPGRHACQRTCQDISELNTLEKNCTYKGEPVSCDKDIRIGTKAMVSCKPGFQTDREYGEENHCLKNGKWKYTMYNCAPICGEFENQDRFEGFRNSIETVDASNAPWNAAVYLTAENGTTTMICGGTLISEEWVITAAKCVKNESGSVRNASEFRVALGKTYKHWNDSRDLDTAQKFQVDEILDDAYFKIFFGGNPAIIDFARHIVVLRVGGMVNFDSVVTPVCLDIQRLNERIPDLIGTVVGWSMSKSSMRLTRFRKLVENNAECKEKLKSHEKLDNPSKFCTPRINQLGNYLGAGLTFKDNRTEKHFVIGILTEHFDDVTVYLGYRDDSSAMIINLMRFYFEQATDVKSVQ